MADEETALRVYTQAEDTVLARVASRIDSGSLALAASRTALAPMITKMRAQYSEDLERMIRLHKLRETARLKSLLEEKLSHVEHQITVLNDLDPALKKPFGVLSQKDRKALQSLEEQKIRESAEFAKKLAEEQRERRTRRRQEARELMAKAKEAEQEALEALESRKAQTLAEIKEAERAKFDALAEKRREYMETVSQLPVRRQKGGRKVSDKPHREAQGKPESWTDVRRHMDDYDRRKKELANSHSQDAVVQRTHGSPKPKYQYNRLFGVLS